MRRTPLLALLTVIALLFAACGDDDTSTATEDTVDDPTEAATEEADVDDDGSDDEDAFSGDLGTCGFLTGFATAFEGFDPTTIYGGGEAADLGQIFAPLAAAAQDVAEAAPAEIRDAFRSVAEGFTLAAEELEGVVLDFTDPAAMDPETMERLETLGTAFEGEYESASAEIEAWMNENCADLADRFDLDAFGS
jgi:hypothetical protein